MANINIELSNELHKHIRIAATLQERTLKDFVINTIEKRLTTPKVKP